SGAGAWLTRKATRSAKAQPANKSVYPAGMSSAATISSMDDFRSMAQDPEHRRRFEKLLYLAAQRGDADLVAERLSWGIDPNCSSASGSTPMMANIRGSCPSATTVKALLAAGADP